MQSLAARIESFAPASPPKSSRTRRVATSKPSWPHSDNFLANPQTLAEAGFYHLPSEEDPDNVICFMCDKQLSQWEKGDDPRRIHIQKCPTCPWVIVKCATQDERDTKGRYSFSEAGRVPNSRAMEKARLETFGRDKQRWWPHDQVKGHGAMSKHMAKAGFVYTPTNDAEDDTATCFYCGTVLSGWEFDDIPLAEHTRREVAVTCPFIMRTVSNSSGKKQSKVKSARNPEDSELEVANAPHAMTKGGRRKKKAEVTALEEIEASETAPEPTPQEQGDRARRLTKRQGSRAPNRPTNDVIIAVASDIEQTDHQPPAPTRGRRQKKNADPEQTEVAESELVYQEGEVNLTKASKKRQGSRVPNQRNGKTNTTRGLEESEAERSDATHATVARGRRRTNKTDNGKLSGPSNITLAREATPEPPPPVKIGPPKSAKKRAVGSRAQTSTLPTGKAIPNGKVSGSEIEESEAQLPPLTKGKRNKNNAKHSAVEQREVATDAEQIEQHSHTAAKGSRRKKVAPATHSEMETDVDVSDVHSQANGRRSRRTKKPKDSALDPLDVPDAGAELTPRISEVEPPKLPKGKGKPKTQPEPQSNDENEESALDDTEELAHEMPTLRAAPSASPEVLPDPGLHFKSPAIDMQLDDTEESEERPPGEYVHPLARSASPEPQMAPEPPNGISDVDVQGNLQDYFPGLLVPRPLTDGLKVEIPALTAAERAMSVEEWIRLEMEKQFEQLKLDGEREIESFRRQAQEVRQRIHAL